MTESRHVASLVVTQGVPENLSQLIETLEEASGVQVKRIDDHHVGISMIG